MQEAQETLTAQIHDLPVASTQSKSPELQWFVRDLEQLQRSERHSGNI